VFAGITAIFVRPVGRPWGSGRLGRLCLDARPRHGRGSLGEPGGREGVALQGCERHSPQHGVEMGGTERREALAQSVIRQSGPRAPWLEESQEAPLLQAGPDCRQGMMAVEHREAQRLPPAAAGEPRGGVGGHSVSMSPATASWRHTPSTKGQWATGRIGCMVSAIMPPFYHPAQVGSS